MDTRISCLCLWPCALHVCIVSLVFVCVCMCLTHCNTEMKVKEHEMCNKQKMKNEASTDQRRIVSVNSAVCQELPRCTQSVTR